MHLQMRIEIQRRNLRLLDTIPVLQRRVQIPRQVIHRAEKIVGISVGRVDAQPTPQPVGGLCILLLFERDAAQLDGKRFSCGHALAPAANAVRASLSRPRCARAIP